MSSSSSAGHTDASVRFVTHNYHALKGLVYVPAGLLAAIVVGIGALVRPDLIVEKRLAFPLILGAGLVTAPWMWWMNSRYEQAYGRCRKGWKTYMGTPMNSGSNAARRFSVLLLLGVGAAAVLNAFLAVPTDDGLVFVQGYTGYFMAYGLFSGLAYTDRTDVTRVYNAAVAVITVALLLPIGLSDPLWAVALPYCIFGLTLAGIGLFHHRLLTDLFGPLSVERDSVYA